MQIGRKLVMHWGTKKGSNVVSIEKIFNLKESKYHFIKDKEAYIYIIDNDLGEIKLGVPSKYDYGHDVNWLMENYNNWMTKEEISRINWDKVDPSIFKV